MNEEELVYLADVSNQKVVARVKKHACNPKYYSQDRRMHGSFMDAKEELLSKMQENFNHISYTFEKIKKEIVDDLAKASSMLEEEAEIGAEPLNNAESLLLKIEEHSGATDLYKWYDECGVEWDDEFMKKSHSAAIGWCAGEFFRTTTYLRKHDYVKIPVSMVKKVIKIFDKVTFDKYGSYSKKEVRELLLEKEQKTK